MELAASLLCLSPPDMVDHETAHRPGGISQKACPVGEAHDFPVRDVEVGLVQQGGSTQGKLGAAPPEFPLGNSVELAIEGGEQLARRRSVACISGLDELGDRRVHGFLPPGRCGREIRCRGTTYGRSERPSKRPLTTVTALNVERSRVIVYFILLTSDCEPVRSGSLASLISASTAQRRHAAWVSRRKRKRLGFSRGAPQHASDRWATQGSANVSAAPPPGPVTAVGANWRGAVVPLPSWPEVFPPQQ